MTYRVTAHELRYVAGTSSKFYRTYVVDRGADTVALTQYGRINTTGRFEILGAPGATLAAAKVRQKQAKGYQHHASRTFDTDPQWFDDTYHRGDAYAIGWKLDADFASSVDAPAPVAEPDDDPTSPTPSTRTHASRPRRTGNITTLLTRGQDLLNQAVTGDDPLQLVGAVLQYHADVEAAGTALAKAQNYVALLTEKVRSAV